MAETTHTLQHQLSRHTDNISPLSIVGLGVIQQLCTERDLKERVTDGFIERETERGKSPSSLLLSAEA